MCPNPSVTLHCTPPYMYNIPNPVLGYLKGFLNSRRITVNNVYWNLVLMREIQEFTRRVETHSRDSMFSLDALILYTWKHLSGLSQERTPLDLFFLSIFTKDELIELVDALKKRIDHYIKEKNLHKARVAGFTMKTYQWLMSSSILDRLKEMNPEMNIVIGGITNEEQGRAFMKVFTRADYAIWGEGEYPLFKLIKSLEGENPLEDVPQLIYRDDTICSTSKRSEAYPLDDYPFADHTDFFESAQTFGHTNMQVFIPIWGSRSCPWNTCKFCVLNEGYSYRCRSPENIVKEIHYQSTKHAVEDFIFVDTELPGNRKRFKTLLNLLLQASAARNEPYHFVAEISPIFIDEETARLMELASFTTIQVGFEAVTDSLLKKMQKRHRFAHNIQTLKLAKRHNLNLIGLNIIRGIPPETDEDILESSFNLKFLRFLLNTYTPNPTLLELYKGAPFYNEMPPDEREAWNYHWFWVEIDSINGIPVNNRFDFLGFIKKESPSHLWDSFETVMNSFIQQNRSYTWIEYKNCSFIEEKGPKSYRYVLDRDETDILICCDLVKSFSQVKREFSHIPEDNLSEILGTLKEFALIYYDKDMHTIISVLDATKRNQVTPQ